MIGIYCIKNKINGKVYIGQSIDIQRRIENHFKEPYGNTYFDRAKKKYGKDNFEWFVLAECGDKKTARDVEDNFINMFKNICGVYNTAKGGQGGDTYFSKTQEELEKTKKKIGMSNHLNNGNKGQYTGEKNSMYNKKWFTNGLYDIVSEEAPEGFKPGRVYNLKRDIELDIEVLDGGDWTKVKSIVKNNQKNVIGWLKFVFENGKEWLTTYDHPFMLANKGRVFAENVKIGDKVFDENNNELEIIDIEESDYIGDSYDLETESDTFDISGIRSHNCRTRLARSVFEESDKTSVKRGNISFTSINLPRLGILANKNIDKFFELLDEKLDLVHDQLLERYKYQCTADKTEFEYMVKNKTMIGAEEFEKSNNAEDMVKHGSLSIGFIGLAETLVSLIGKHHGESEEAQELGLKIVKHMRDYCDKKAEEEKLNWSLLGTPAEGLSNRFTKIDLENFGKIDGVTDHEFYTNSSHVPVYHKISAFKKIEIEAPYHELENAGHICYIEMDGDPSNNIEAVEKVVRKMHDEGIGYSSINHPVDRCKDCGFSGIMNDKCPICGSTDIERLRRITGYLVGDLKRWNGGKRAEEKQRVKHI